MFEFSVAVGIIVVEVAFVNRAISMYQSTLAIGFVIGPFAFEFAPVRSELYAPPLAEARFCPLTHVDRTILDFLSPVRYEFLW